MQEDINEFFCDTELNIECILIQVKNNEKKTKSRFIIWKYFNKVALNYYGEGMEARCRIVEGHSMDSRSNYSICNLRNLMFETKGL